MLTSVYKKSLLFELGGKNKPLHYQSDTNHLKNGDIVNQVKWLGMGQLK